MSEGRSPRPDPASLGVIPKPPFVRLPEPAALFADRAARFRRLAEGHGLGPYLLFLAGLSEAQAAVQEGLPAPALPAPEQLERARRHAMPPLDRAGFTADAGAQALLDRLLASAAGIEMPAEAAAALARVTAAGPGERAAMLAAAVVDAVPPDAVAEHALVAAAAQVHFARLAAGLDPKGLKPVADGVCPACGGAPSASLIVGWPGAERTRYCACALCGTLWNYVRAKCTLCGSTKEISFREIAGGDGSVKAEACGDCRGYVKVLYADKHPELDPVADDVASLGLDLLMRDAGFRRGAVNPFLAGY
jgi:FdhE protein